MKTKVLALILAILCVSLMAVSCGKDPCETHVDDNKDAICDVCGEKIACVTHTDEDKNGVCDVCGATVTCETHTDADQNGLCDICGASVTPACTEHTDADQNGLCDVCGAAMSAAPAVCEHKDDNADNVCDLCGKAIVIKVEQVPAATPTRVPMVVKPIPTDANPMDYMSYQPYTVKSMEKLTYDSRNGVYIYTKTETADGTSYVYTVKNIETGAVVWTETLSKDDAAAGVTLESACFLLRKSTATVGEYVYSYYTYNGTLIYTVTGSTSPTLDEESLLDGSFYKLTFDGKQIFVVRRDNESLVVGPIAPIAYVNPPSFDEIGDRYGYIEKNGVLYVYDLASWNNCLYSFTIPAYYDDADYFALENGNVLLQGIIELPQSAVSYDWIDGGDKYDLVYTIIDPVAKTATEVEFGYYIFSSAVPRWQSLSTGSMKMNENVQNMMLLIPIDHDAPAINQAFVAVVDNDLNILCQLMKDINMSSGGMMMDMVASDLFVTEHPVLDNKVTVNFNGDIVAYIPQSASMFNSYVLCDGKYYNYKMELVFDPAVDGYTLEASSYNYRIFKKTNAETSAVEYYFFNGSSAPVKIELPEIQSVQARTDYMFVTYQVDGVNKYCLYNSLGTALGELEAPLSSTILTLNDNLEMVYTTSSGLYYILHF